MDNNLHQIIARELLEENKEVKSKFLDTFQSEITEFIDAIVESCRTWLKYDATIGTNRRRAFVSAFVFNAISNLLTSMKIFIFGYSTPSGNLVRQTIESICSAILCSSGKLQFYEQVEQDKFSSKNTIRLVLKHSKEFQINRNAMLALRKLYEFYHKLSHSSSLTLAHNISMSNLGKIYVGPSFDDKKMFAYRKEVTNRINLAKNITNVLEGILIEQKGGS